MASVVTWSHLMAYTFFKCRKGNQLRRFLYVRAELYSSTALHVGGEEFRINRPRNWREKARLVILIKCKNDVASPSSSLAHPVLGEPSPSLAGRWKNKITVSPFDEAASRTCLPAVDWCTLSRHFMLSKPHAFGKRIDNLSTGKNNGYPIAVPCHHSCQPQGN